MFMWSLGPLNAGPSKDPGAETCAACSSDEVHDAQFGLQSILWIVGP